ncbi:hypothetical protein H6F90_26495 [Trichocoleus sp. FACHB-591]|nr:hypothetical protein [Trichocoleus sp. FACHB-591]MBD2098617.1 hypothetical protein [Trichocoleus sp. FACHB-591]
MTNSSQGVKVAGDRSAMLLSNGLPPHFAMFDRNLSLADVGFWHTQV